MSFEFALNSFLQLPLGSAKRHARTSRGSRGNVLFVTQSTLSVSFQKLTISTLCLMSSANTLLSDEDEPRPSFHMPLMPFKFVSISASTLYEIWNSFTTTNTTRPSVTSYGT
jgi:hypothetical protein